MPNDRGPTPFFGKIRYKDGLLCMPHYSGWAFFNRPLMTTHEIGRHVRLDGVQSHRVSNRIVQRQSHEIDVHHTGKALGKVAKEFVEIAM